MKKYLYDVQKCLFDIKRKGNTLRIHSHLDLGHRRDFRTAISTGSRSSSLWSLAETAPLYRVIQKSPPRAAAALVCADKRQITEPIRCMSMAMLPYYFAIKTNDKRNVIQRTSPIRHQCWHLIICIPSDLTQP